MRRKCKNWICAAMTVLLLAAGAAAQPVVHDDLTVTFQLKAPNAKQVYLGSEAFGFAPPGILMTRQDDGTWTVTSPPLEPGWYPYGFIVDGLFTIDPANPNLRPQLTSGNPLNNILVVRGKDPFVYDYDPSVPKGTVHLETLQSANFKRSVQCWVYTPNGYETSNKKYPVLYLMHGNPGDAGRWVKFAAADVTLDNLIASGKIQDMVVVMPDAQAPFSAVPTTADSQLADLVVFEKYLLEEILPFVEDKYRVQATPDARWIAGLSRGALQTLHVVFKHPDLFSAAGAFSTALPRAFPDAYPAAAKANTLVRLLYYSCGVKDGTVPYSAYQQSEALLTQLGITHAAATTTQDHTWENFRRELAVFLLRAQQ